MRILIKTSQYSTFLTTDAEHMPALVNLLPHLRVVESSGWSDTLTYTVAEMPPDMSFEQDAKLAGTSKREAELIESLQKKNSDWARAYAEANELRAKLAVLESQS